MRKEENRPKVCVVCGAKNTGKTTLIERLLGEYAARGIRTAVIKHDGHDFTCDVPGTDSSRFYEAGAYGIAVFSSSRIFVHRRESHMHGDRNAWEAEKAAELAALFPDAEIILIEGLKNTSLPKIEVVRSEISDSPISNTAGRFLIVTDLPQDRFDGKTLNFAQIEDIADMVLAYSVNIDPDPVSMS